jgi:hypothetical protein
MSYCIDKHRSCVHILERDGAHASYRTPLEIDVVFSHPLHVVHHVGVLKHHRPQCRVIW